MFSVLIPAYNAAETLPRALASLQAQSHADWELVVVEDGSRDDTESIVSRFASIATRPVRYENHGVNQGVSAARSRLLALARGEAIAFLDADDYWSPHHLESAAKLIASGADLVASPVRTFDLATNVTLGNDAPPAALVSDPVATLFNESVIITSSSVVLTRELATRVGDFDRRFSIGEDRDFWLRAALLGARFAIGTEATCHYAKHAGSTMARTLNVAAQNVQFFEKYLRDSRIPDNLRRRQLARSLIDEGRLLRADDARASAHRLWRAWRLVPSNLAAAAHLAFSTSRAAVRGGG